MENMFKKSVCALVLGASALAFSATHVFALPVVVTDSVDPYLFKGNGGANSDYAFQFNLSNDANWGNFELVLNQGYVIREANLHVWLTPADDGFNSDRHRVFTTSGLVTDNSDPKLTPIAGGGIDDQVVRLKRDLGFYIDGVNFVVGQPTEYEFDLVDWYSADDLKWLVVNNLGIVNVGSADDSYVTQGQLTVTAAIANPEPATLILFGSGLIGLVGWRLRNKQGQA